MNREAIEGAAKLGEPLCAWGLLLFSLLLRPACRWLPWDVCPKVSPTTGPTSMRVTSKGALLSPSCVRASHFSANEHHCSNRSGAVCSLRGVQAALEARGE